MLYYGKMAKMIVGLQIYMHKTKRKLILGNLQNFSVWIGIGETIHQTFPTHDKEMLGKILNN
jgi:hypothetical protein